MLFIISREAPSFEEIALLFHLQIHTGSIDVIDSIQKDDKDLVGFYRLDINSRPKKP